MQRTSDGEEGLPFRKPDPCLWTCRAVPFGNGPWLMLLLDFAVEFQQLHQLGIYLGRAMPGQDALNGPVSEVVAEILPLVHSRSTMDRIPSRPTSDQKFWSDQSGSHVLQ